VHFQLPSSLKLPHHDLFSCRRGITSEVKRNTMPPIKAERPLAVSPQLQRHARQQIKAEPAVSLQSTPQPITPTKRRRQRNDSDDDFEPQSPSPTKKAKTPRKVPQATGSTAPGTSTGAPQTPRRQVVTMRDAARTPGGTPGTPSQRELSDAQRVQKEEWKTEWFAWVVRHLWTKVNEFKHPMGTYTIYRVKGKLGRDVHPLIHRTLT
jgi:hypothetical protein